MQLAVASSRIVNCKLPTAYFPEAPNLTTRSTKREL